MASESTLDDLSSSDDFSIELDGFSEYRVSTRSGLSLKGTGPFWGYLNLETTDKKRYDVSTLEVWVYVAPADGETATDAFHVSSKEGDAAAWLSVFVPEPLFDVLKDPAPKRVVFGFSLPKGPRVLNDGSFVSRVTHTSVDIEEYRAPAPREYSLFPDDSRIAQFTVTNESQVFTIAKELLTSYEGLARRDPAARRDRNAYLNAISSLLFDLRYAARNVPGSDSPLTSNLEDFKEHIKTLDEKAADKLRYAFDTLWHLPDVKPLLAAHKLEPKDTGERSASLLEEASHAYCVSKLTSPTLETLLIGGLLLAETAAFARSVQYLPFANLKVLVGKGLLKALGFVFSEGLSLTLTAVVASVVDNGHGIGFWAVFSTITLIRWLRPGSQKQDQDRLRLLLASMCDVYGRIRHGQYNPRLLRELLYDVEKKGAVFSPCVFNLLDKRIARETLVTAGA